MPFDCTPEDHREEPEEPYAIFATVRIRRGPGWQVNPEAESIDGGRYLFTRGWKIDDIDCYTGEIAWIPDRGEAWPGNGPGWIASGDLADVERDGGEFIRRAKARLSGRLKSI